MSCTINLGRPNYLALLDRRHRHCGRGLAGAVFLVVVAVGPMLQVPVAYGAVLQHVALVSGVALGEVGEAVLMADFGQVYVGLPLFPVSGWSLHLNQECLPLAALLATGVAVLQWVCACCPLGHEQLSLDWYLYDLLWLPQAW